MISVEEGLNILLSHTITYGVEDVDLHQSTGRILRENIYADRDMPPFDRVSMDGIAIRFEDYEVGTRTFHIDGIAAAGSPVQNLNDSKHCLEIMTGSILPLGADTIVPYEWLKIEDGRARIIKENVIRGQNVHIRGKDRKQGDLLIPAGRLISNTEIGILAAVGKSFVPVSRLPKVIIISTGDEIVEIDQEPLPHQVRMSNVHQLKSAMQHFRIEAETKHWNDNFEIITKEIEGCLALNDVMIISGGVSEGKFDHIPSALEANGVQKHFYKIQQRPGKPFWYGTHPGGCHVFAIPGNPVSSFLCYIRYIHPWIERSIQQTASPQLVAKLSQDVSFTPDLTYFLTVRLKQNDLAELIAIPVPGHGSGDLSVLADADAFIELPPERVLFRKGEVFPVFRFHT